MNNAVSARIARSIIQRGACGSLCIVGTIIQTPAPIDIPFTFETRQPIVAVRVNGSDPLPFVVDTGASVHVIDRALAQRLISRELESPLRAMSGGGEGTVQAQAVEGLSLAAAGATWKEQRAVTVALGYPKDKHFAGLIGAPILLRYVVRFSFARRVITLIDPASYSPPPAAVRIPFELQDDLPIVRATIDAGNGPVEARLMVDTGASQFIDLNRPFVDAHRLVEAMPDAAAIARPAALGSPAPFLYGTGRRVVFGDRTFDRPRIGLSRATSGSSSRSQRDGIIGNDLLRHFTVTFDYQHRVVVLEP
jgi:predicted aspartyl protease